MNFKLLIILELALVQSSLISAYKYDTPEYEQYPTYKTSTRYQSPSYYRLPRKYESSHPYYPQSTYQSPPMYQQPPQYYEPVKYMQPTTALRWSYFWEIGNMNPTFEDITLNQVDCELFQNIIHYDFDRISFDFDFVRMFGYDNVDLGLSFGVKLDQLRIKCPNVKVVIDSEFIWDAEFASVIQNSVIQTSLVTGFVGFCNRYSLEGLVVNFSEDIPLDDALTESFFTELSIAFKANNLVLLGYFYQQGNFNYVRPVVFDFLDELIVEMMDDEAEDELVINIPIVGETGLQTIIDTFVNFGANPEKITLQFPLYGRSYKRRTTLDSLIYDEVGGQPPAVGIGSFLFADGLLVDSMKSQTANYHDQIQIYKIEQDPTWKKEVDPIQKTPYAVKGATWVSYNDFQSFRIKIDIIKANEIGGIVIDGLNFDDFNGITGRGTNPYTKHILSLLNYYY